MLTTLAQNWWAILRGIFEIIAAVQLRKEIDNEWLLGLGVFGALTIFLGFRLEGLKDRRPS